ITVGGRAAATIRGRDVHLAIDVNEFQKVPSFPIFWANVIEFARKGQGGFLVPRTGRPFAVSPSARVQAPEGAIWSLSPDGSFVAHTVGAYRLGLPDGVVTLRVNLLDERESDTGGQARALDWNPASSEGRERIHRSYGGWAAGAALVFLFLALLLQLRP